MVGEERMAVPRRSIKTSKSTDTNNYFSIINGMIDTAWVIDKDGNIIAVNDSAVRLLGYSREELIKNGLAAIDSSLTEEEILELIHTMPADKIQVFETSHRAKDGRVIPIEICSSLINYDGEEVILSIARDITERKWAEAEIQKQLDEKQTLLRAIHHRIKNNIASLESLLSLKARTTDNKEAADLLHEAIGRASCIRILYELLLRSEDFTNSSVKEFLCKIMDTIIPLYPGSEHIRREGEIDDFMLSETYLFPLGVIFEELVTNILKYAFDNPKDGIIRLKVKKNEKGIYFELSDNGKGLPSGTDGRRHNGFGLAIVKMLAHQIDGSFSMENNPDGPGTRCTIVFGN
ncbi:MAG: PAS domain S-box protein [Spirochaetales bacterium]|nr:PAS domain S-box protein [Spirochaetales bacterium]